MCAGLPAAGRHTLLSGRPLSTACAAALRHVCLRRQAARTGLSRMDLRIDHCTAAWHLELASTANAEPDVVLACRGRSDARDVGLRRQSCVRNCPSCCAVVNVVDLLRLRPDSGHPSMACPKLIRQTVATPPSAPAQPGFGPAALLSYTARSLLAPPQSHGSFRSRHSYVRFAPSPPRSACDRRSSSRVADNAERPIRRRHPRRRRRLDRPSRPPVHASIPGGSDPNR